MSKIDRRNVLRIGLASVALPGATILQLGCAPEQDQAAGNGETLPNAPSSGDNASNAESNAEKANQNADENTDKNAEKGTAMKIQYLELVTPDVDAACTLYSKMHGVTFAEPNPMLGGARTAELAGGGMLGIRGPLRDTETPVVRPYMLVEDIKACVAAAAEAGGEIAMPPTEIPGQGQFAIVIQGGIESGLWQL